jgi:phosphatidylglycerophosphatase A
VRGISSSDRYPLSSIGRKIIVFLVTGFGVGYFPRLPGTLGTTVAVPFSLGLNAIAAISLPLALLALATAISCAIWLSSKVAEQLGQKDPAVIVIDEIAGFLVANFLSPPRIVPLVLAFLVFRLFDIAKVFPLSRLEKLPGGTGIVLDDVMAGIYTFVIMRFLFTWGLL